MKIYHLKLWSFKLFDQLTCVQTFHISLVTYACDKGNKRPFPRATTLGNKKTSARKQIMTNILYLSSKVIFPALLSLNTATVGPPNNEGPKDWYNMFAITRLFFMYFHITGVKKISRYVEVPTISDARDINLFEWFAPTFACSNSFRHQLSKT